MKSVYLDTNVLLSVLRSSEPVFDIIQKFRLQKNLKFYTGVITLVEMTSVLTREENLLKQALLELSNKSGFDSLISLSFRDQIRLIIDFLISVLNVEILGDPNIETDNIVNQSISMNLTHKIAFIHGSQSKLRTLDNLHFSIVKTYNDLLDFKINYLITTDNNFISKRNFCLSISNITIIHPESFAQIEGF